MEITRRKLLTSTTVIAGTGLSAGCLGGSSDPGGSSDTQSSAAGTTARASFFVFDDVTGAVAGDAATTELLVPVGQHGHGWEPGPRVREDIHEADLLVHGVEGFQPWVDDILGDLEHDGSAVNAVDVSTDVDLLAARETHDHDDSDGHDHATDTHEHDETDDHDSDGHDDGSGTDPHFWMDPLRLRAAVETVQEALVDVDRDDVETYETNAATYRDRLEELHERIAAVVEDASSNVLLVAGHNSFRYFADRYDVEIEALTGVSPDDQPTARDIERAQEVIERHDLEYICADPIESQKAAEQLVEETSATEVLPLTAVPGLTTEWADQEWEYVEIIEEVNVPTIQRALGGE